MGVMRGLLVVAGVLAFASSAYADGYSKWSYNQKKKRHECVYEYKNTGGGTSYNTVIRYPKADPKAGYDYFANSKGEYWAKCMNSYSKGYEKGKMQWVECDPTGKALKAYPPGDCPTPKDGAKPITADVPDPDDEGEPNPQ